jgi:hypothetical protein
LPFDTQPELVFDHGRDIIMSNEIKKPLKSEKVQAQGASNSLRGWPGYRTRRGRSGLDPIDSGAEEGHMLGILVHDLLSGKLRTKNPFFLVLLAVLGILCISPFLLAIAEAYRGDLLPLGAWVVITISCLLGLAMLTGLIKNLFNTRGK